VRPCPSKKREKEGARENRVPMAAQREKIGNKTMYKRLPMGLFSLFQNIAYMPKLKTRVPHNLKKKLLKRNLQDLSLLIGATLTKCLRLSSL
jgi:hypothetical protein